MVITPSIYEKTLSGFKNQIAKLSPYFPRFQIDISDGIYAPNKTIQIEEITDFFSTHQPPITNHLLFDFHLMVQDYKEEIKKLDNWPFKNLSNILIHYSQKPSLQTPTTNYQSPIGLVLNTQNSVDSLVKDYNLRKIPIIQIMTVEIGAQGNSFIPESLKKIEQMKNAGFIGQIFLDGGINDKTLPLILSQKYLPDVLCPGSFLTQANDEELPIKVSYLKKACLV